jgi:hypothetical protein
LIDPGELRLAMELLLELMKQGSYQVEMGEEGSQDSEECLAVVMKALNSAIFQRVKDRVVRGDAQT